MTSLRLLAPTLLLVIALVLVLTGVAWWVVGRHIWRVPIETKEPEDTCERMGCNDGGVGLPGSAGNRRAGGTGQLWSHSRHDKLVAVLSHEQQLAYGVDAGERRMVKDLVCGIEVDPRFSRVSRYTEAAATISVARAGCQSAFERSPERYLCAAAPSERLRSDFTQLVDWAERLDEPAITRRANALSTMGSLRDADRSCGWDR